MQLEKEVTLESEDVQKVYRKILKVVIFSQMLGGAGLAAGITVGALIAQQMLGTDTYSGIPVALFTAGSAIGAYIVGVITQRKGRRLGLATGFLLGGAGAVAIIISTVLNSIPLLFISLLIYGFGTATNLQARYAATDLALPKQRATAVSVAMVATTVGAVVGPNLVGVMGHLALFLHIPELAGIFILSAFAFISAGLVFFFFLKPDPFLMAKQIVQQTVVENTSSEQVKSWTLQPVLIGALIMIFTQIIMTSIMTMTPIHMQHSGQAVNAVGLVIGFHIAAMYLPSLFTGMLITKYGTKLVGILSGVILILASLTTYFSSGHSVVTLVIGLVLLGLGWNFGLISGTTAVINGTTTMIRPKIQSRIDIFIAISGSLAGVASGFIVNYTSFSILSMTACIIAVLLLLILLLSKSNEKVA